MRGDRVGWIGNDETDMEDLTDDLQGMRCLFEIAPIRYAAHIVCCASSTWPQLGCGSHGGRRRGLLILSVQQPHGCVSPHSPRLMQNQFIRTNLRDEPSRVRLTSVGRRRRYTVVRRDERSVRCTRASLRLGTRRRTTGRLVQFRSDYNGQGLMVSVSHINKSFFACVAEDVTAWSQHAYA